MGTILLNKESGFRKANVSLELLKNENNADNIAMGSIANNARKPKMNTWNI